MVALIPLLPLAGFIITLLVGKRLQQQAHLLPVALVTATAALCVYAFVWVLDHEGEVFLDRPFTWITAGTFDVQWGFLVDALTGIMLLVVGIIGMLVHYYSIGYMSDDPGYYRFFAYLNLFMFAMFVLILANNYLLLFLGWEGVGLCSYLLISFWFRKKSASQAGKKAFLVNRVGDFGFTLGMFLDLRHHRHAAVHRRLRKRRRRMIGAGTLPGSACCSSPAPWARAPSSRCTSGCRTPWRAPRRSARSSTPRPWSTPACTWWRAPTRCSSTPTRRCSS